MRDALERPSRIVAFDLGMTTGWAQHLDGTLTSGWHENRRSKHDSAGMVFLKFRMWLTRMHDRAGGWDCIYYEMVNFTKGVYASHVYGGMWAIVSGFAEENEIPYQGIAPSEVKKFATGSGAANKERVLYAVRERWAPNVKEHNEADAVALLYYALENLGIRTDLPLLNSEESLD